MKFLWKTKKVMWYFGEIEEVLLTAVTNDIKKQIMNLNWFFVLNGFKKQDKIKIKCLENFISTLNCDVIF
jgi:hypothetical protein